MFWRSADGWVEISVGFPTNMLRAFLLQFNLNLWRRLLSVHIGEVSGHGAPPHFTSKMIPLSELSMLVHESGQVELQTQNQTNVWLLQSICPRNCVLTFCYWPKEWLVAIFLSVLPPTQKQLRRTFRPFITPIFGLKCSARAIKYIDFNTLPYHKPCPQSLNFSIRARKLSRLAPLLGTTRPLPLLKMLA